MTSEKPTSLSYPDRFPFYILWIFLLLQNNEGQPTNGDHCFSKGAREPDRHTKGRGEADIEATAFLNLLQHYAIKHLLVEKVYTRLKVQRKKVFVGINYFVVLIIKFHGFCWECIWADTQMKGRHIGAQPCVTWLLAVQGGCACLCVCMCMCVLAHIFTKCTSIWSPCDCRDAINAARPWELILCAAFIPWCLDGTACLHYYTTVFKLLMTLRHERVRLFFKCAREMGQIISVRISLHCCNLLQYQCSQFCWQPNVRLHAAESF